MNKWLLLITALIISPVLYAKGKRHLNEPPALHVVDQLNVNRFMGTWYEIARFPSANSHGCENAIVQYNRAADGSIKVLNICRRLENGQLFETNGVAQAADDSLAKMNVNYLPHWMQWTNLGSGKFWVIDLAKDYSYAVISEPNRRFVRILSRTPSIAKDTYDRIATQLLAQHFAPELLVASRPNSVTAR